ncbi:hypothetical protein HMI54_006414 [Coelomomyces lativittatus]|nr:hypothetical protein HMI54_006414 [Coelomomyces lativittatus]
MSVLDPEFFEDPNWASSHGGATSTGVGGGGKAKIIDIDAIIEKVLSLGGGHYNGFGNFNSDFVNHASSSSSSSSSFSGTNSVPSTKTKKQSFFLPSKTFPFKQSDIMAVLHAARDILLSQPALIELHPPVKIVTFMDNSRIY